MNYLQYKHRIRNLRQKLFGINSGVIGGYHGGNLGDMALGISVTDLLEKRGVKTGLQTIYNLDKWPKSKFAIVGGGAVGYADSLLKVANRYKGEFDNVALLGVDFNEESYPEECLELIRGAAYVSGRSEKQALKLRLISGRQNIFFHPDIAFSLFKEYCETQRKKNLNGVKSKIFLVNVLPLYGDVKDSIIIPAEKYRVERPALFNSFELLHESYKKYVRDVVGKAIAQGFTIETIPFTPQDAEYAKLILVDLPVLHSEYISDPKKMIQKISTAGMVLATRFHATIFTLKLGIPLYPIAYATKNELLLQELGIDRKQFLSSDDLAKGDFHSQDPIVVDSRQISHFESMSNDAINSSIDAIHRNHKN